MAATVIPWWVLVLLGLIDESVALIALGILLLLGEAIIVGGVVIGA